MKLTPPESLRSISNLLSTNSPNEASLASSMDQGSAPVRHTRGLLDVLAPPSGGRLSAALQHLRSRAWLLVIVLIACGTYLYFVSAGGIRHWPIYGTYLDLQADGFRSGHLYLPLEPAPELLRAADPRDRVNQRYWALDASYFRGKYYCYWGPTPAIFQALIKSLLGITRTIGDQYIGLFSACLIALSGSLIIERMARRLFGVVPRVVVVFAILAFAFANPMLHNVTTAGTYQSAILSAQAWLVPGVLLAFDTVWHAGTSSARRSRQLLAGLCWGLAIASRVTVLPTVALLLAFTALAEGWVSDRRWTKSFVNALWLGVPVSVICIGLLVFNWLRFDDPLQFGINLQLSGYPPMSYKGSFFLPNLYSYVLRPFVSSCQFPYIYQVWWNNAENAFPKGFPVPSDYNMDEPIIGWLRVVPITWFIACALLLVPRPLSLHTRRARVYLWCLACFLTMGSVSGLTALGNYAGTMRYLSDVTPGLVLAGVLGAFALRAHLFGLVAPKLVSGAIILLASATIILGGLLGYQGYAGHFHKFNPELDAALVKTLSFCGTSDPKVPRFWP